MVASKRNIMISVVVMVAVTLFVLQLVGAITGKDYKVSLLFFIALLGAGLIIISKLIIAASPTESLKGDDWVAIFIAMAVIGALLWFFKDYFLQSFTIIGLP